MSPVRPLRRGPLPAVGAEMQPLPRSSDHGGALERAAGACPGLARERRKR
eukprot:CAMPEP_0179153418 /NCGR_PEP_ID=MMETSP0796-20121207/74604_1 /TAXON_ID=73915 /ORGANISM="Pyrodinium bahamense, Strain pbaha01" /LENGTH=49 /DNA_ID= /DNA_START= /DNA_END= /DNA_ORIENTATION=